MEGVSATMYKGIKRYWRTKDYQRLNGVGRKRKVRVVKLASIGEEGVSTRRRRFWRVNLTRRLKLKLKLRFSPKKFMIGLRDAYVNMMMKIANSRMIAGGGYGSGDGVSGFGRRPMKEYDERMIVEIYKSIVMAQGQLVPRDAAWISSGITCNR